MEGADALTVTLLQGDCLEHMRGMAAGCVDLIVTDPPYGIAFQSNGAKVKRYDVLKNDDSFDLSLYWDDMQRVVKDAGAIYLYCRWDVAYEWQKIVKPDSQIVIPRGRVSMGDLDDYSDEYEVVLFKRIGAHAIDATPLRIPNNSHAKNPPKYKVRIGNLWTELETNEAWERAEHPTQKTTSSASKMIQVSSTPGATILDPFMGSGTTGAAAVQLGRRFIGIELDPHYFSVASRRIAAAQAQMVMPL